VYRFLALTLIDVLNLGSTRQLARSLHRFGSSLRRGPCEPRYLCSRSNRYVCTEIVWQLRRKQARYGNPWTLLFVTTPQPDHSKFRQSNLRMAETFKEAAVVVWVIDVCGTARPSVRACWVVRAWDGGPDSPADSSVRVVQSLEFF